MRCVTRSFPVCFHHVGKTFPGELVFLIYCLLEAWMILAWRIAAEAFHYSFGYHLNAPYNGNVVDVQQTVSLPDQLDGINYYDPKWPRLQSEQRIRFVWTVVKEVVPWLLKRKHVSFVKFPCNCDFHSSDWSISLGFTWHSGQTLCTVIWQDLRPSALPSVRWNRIWFDSFGHPSWTFPFIWDIRYKSSNAVPFQRSEKFPLWPISSTCIGIKNPSLSLWRHAAFWTSYY